MSQITCYNSKIIFENVKRGTRPPKATNLTLHNYNFKNKKYIFSKLFEKGGKKTTKQQIPHYRNTSSQMQFPKSKNNL